ncbi:MAG: peptidoglycan DD-metalloendopeptidase family protein [Pseudomonadota bacterium]|nr:peptidoglycan DD-metalloendopeptidase family protein [Pseudomonadota bacterium]
MHYYTRLLIITLALFCNLTFAKFSTQDNLQTVNKQITETKHKLKYKQEHVSQLQSQLGAAETRLSSLQSSLDGTNKNVRQLQKAIAETRKNLNALNHSREQQQSLLAQQLVSNYLLGKKHPLKILLNNEDPARIDRLNYYASILAKQQIDAIKELDTTEIHLALAKTNLDRKLTQLNGLFLKQRKMKESMQQQQHSRSEVLTKLNQLIVNDKEQLQTLQANKARLESLMTRLQRSPKYVGKYFNLHHRGLLWPIKGEIVTDFGQLIKETQVRSNGMIIGAKAGTPVKAIAPGKVVFAEWLAGFGQLLIIDHGTGYMSLYGHNQELLKEVGQIVKAGEEVASVGNSGGLSDPGLFFSVRYNGKPINPHSCCQNSA